MFAKHYAPPHYAPYIFNKRHMWTAGRPVKNTGTVYKATLSEGMQN